MFVRGPPRFTTILPLFYQYQNWFKFQHKSKGRRNCENCTKKQQKRHPTRRLFCEIWQGHKDLNPEPTVLETAALPIELYPYMVGLRGLEPRTDRL